MGIRSLLDDAVPLARLHGEAVAPEHARHVRARALGRVLRHRVLPRKTCPRARARFGRPGSRPHLHALRHDGDLGKHLENEPVDVRGGEGLPHRHAQFGQPREALRHPLRRAAVPLALAEGPRPPAYRVPHARVLPRHRKRAPGNRRGRGCAENVQGRACARRRAHLRPGGTRKLLRRRACKQAVSERRLGQPRAAARLHRAWHPRDLRRCCAPRERGRPFKKPP